jgi:hypothetical protein
MRPDLDEAKDETKKKEAKNDESAEQTETKDDKQEVIDCPENCVVGPKLWHNEKLTQTFRCLDEKDAPEGSPA